MIFFTAYSSKLARPVLPLNLGLSSPSPFLYLKAGSNLLKPHKIQFFLYFPTQIAADQAASRIREMGFEVEVEKGAKGEDWLCLADRTMIPELSAIQKITRDFGALAASLNGEYDGWEARIEK